MRLPVHTPAFRWLWFSTLCMFGVQGLERIATAWISLETGGPLGVGLALAARTLPALLFGLLAGTMADRGNRVHQLMLVSAVSLPVMVVAVVLTSQGWLSGWVVIAYSFLFGCIQVFDTPARQALILDTVPVEEASAAFAVSAAGTRLAFAIGAGLGGWFIATLGIWSCYLAVAFCLVLSLLVLTQVRVASSTRDRETVPFGQALLGAARLVIDVPAVRLLSIVGITCEIFAFSHGTALPVLARDVLDSGATGLGGLQAASSTGALVAVLGLALLPNRIRREPVMTLVFITFGLALVVLSRIVSLPAAIGIMVVVGACAALFDTLQQTLLQLAVPAEQRGRAAGIWMVGIGSAPIGHLEMGFLAATLGAPLALLINGSIVVTSAVLLMVLVPSYALLSLRPKENSPTTEQS